VTFYAVGLYELRLVRDFVELVGSLLVSAAACWVLGTMYFYLTTPYTDLAPKTHLLLTIGLSHAAFLIWRRALLALSSFSLLDLRILVLADDHHREYLRLSTHRRFSGELNVVDSLNKDLDLVVVDRTWADGDPRQARHQLVAAVASQVPIVSLDEFYESLFGKVSSIHANDLSWAIEHVLSRAGSLYFKAKRLVDIAASVALLILLAPVLAITAIAIRLVDGMSPFYGQERTGYLRKKFVLWKFQTMTPGADAQGPFAPEAGESDPRVTPLGRALRRFRFDELPQLWNVLRGDMSLVGPRPEWIREVEILETVVPTYHLRHLVKPGITGWAQVYFRSTNNAQDSREKHQYDLYYLKHFSLALDFTIMLKTIKRIFVQDSRVVSAGSPATAGHFDQDRPGSHLDVGSIVGP
jgi:lipopolysaccharide/colanic/teichoic acid biosynthesis glycosyltransferase